jgi:ATP-dependent Lon protease
MTVPAVDSVSDEVDVKLADAFGGRVVRKDLVKNTKVGFNVPVYVLEYLLGRYCSSTDPSIVAEGLEHVKSIIAERFVRADEGELIKSRTRERGSMRLIDKVTVTYRETEDKYWASLANSGLSYVHIAPHLVQQYENLLVGGVWASVEGRYDDSLQHRGVTRPFTIEQLQPIQIASADLDEYIDGRRHFTRNEWIDVLIRSIGYEPTHPDFTFRRKLLYLLRLVPMVEHNYNLVELGPRGTGKSFVYREISPYVILVSGGQVTVPKLFVENSPPYRIGLVGVWDVVAFDEVAGSQFRRPEEKQIYKDYMEMGSFSRGSGKGTIPAYASFVFNGNIDGDVETRARTSHLFTSFPESIRYDMAFHDRWHAYVPGWELPKMQPDYFTNHLGFIVDYLAEISRELRKRNYTDAYERHFRLGNHVEERDRKAIVKTVSGLLKLFHPDGQCEKAELEQYLSFAIEMRRRVKEQLKRMGGIEYAKVNLSYIDLENGQETFVLCPELGMMQLIPEGQLEPGDVFTVGFDKGEGRFGLFRVQVQATKGSGHLRVTGNPSRPMRDALQTAYDYLRANLRRFGSDRDLKDFDLHVQIQSLMQAKEGSGTGMALFIALLSAVLARPLVPQLVILGDLTIHGVLMRVDSLADKLKTAMDAGAKKVMIPTENKRDFADLPADIIDKLQIVFYSEPTNAAFRAMGLE